MARALAFSALSLLLISAAGTPQLNLRSSPANKTAPPAEVTRQTAKQSVASGDAAEDAVDVAAAADDVATAKVEAGPSLPTAFLPTQSVKAVPEASPGSIDSTLSSMEAEMTDLMLKGKTAFGATPMGGSVKTIKNLLLNIMLPKVKAAHGADVKTLKRLYAEFAKCGNTMIRSRRGANSQMAAYSSSSKQHKTCRGDEAVKFQSQKNCLVQQKNLFMIKKGKCDNFKTISTKLSTTKDNRAIVTKAGSESVESYITRISVTICGRHVHGKRGQNKKTGGWGGGLANGFLDQFYKAKDACDRAEKEWKNKVKECRRKVADWKKRKGQCDQFQTTMDAASCKGAIMSNDACQTYSECYTRTLKNYNSFVKKCKAEVIDRKAEWRGLHRIACLINGFADGKVTGAEVDKCKAKSHSTKPMDIKFLPPPPRSKCEITQLYPATGKYKRKEFAPLPMFAKGKEPVECAGMQEISVKPRKGSPSSCKCERVTLNGPYSAKAMVKCTKCNDVRRLADTDSCPTGTKLFAPASKQDWQTFLASADALRDPHFIVDITRPRDGCPGCTTNAMNSANRKQRANGWSTSDGSPWWLRSKRYGEPNGDYLANCYLNIGSARAGRENDITFNDAKCQYHSKSYYCQLTNINLQPSGKSPKSCKCSSVDLAGSYTPGRLIKCSECIDVSKSTQQNSCPRGTKIFSPTSARDWRTFIKSATPLNAPHFIIDVTRGSDGCQRSKSGCEKSGMNSKNPKQATWRTSDRSPWWLRSSSYNQPDGSYKANCFLHLWNTPHNSETNIQFDDGNRGGACLYHSRSYYCQPKMKSKAALRRAQQKAKDALRKQRERDAARKRQLQRRKKKAASSCKVYLYEHGGYRGRRAVFGLGHYKYNIFRRKFPNDSLSSVMVRGAGCKAVVYEHGNFKGRRQVYATGRRSVRKWGFVGRRFNDKASSMVVSQDGQKGKKKKRSRRR